MSKWFVGMLVGVVVLGWSAAPAGATMPGFVGKIAVTRGDIWVMNPDGSNATDITNEYVYPSGPGGPGADFCGASWSPNGAQIAYLREPNSPLPTDYGDSYYPELVVANADGSAAHELLGPAPTQDTRPNVLSCERPTWSPNGTELAYSGGGHHGGSTGWQLFVLGADGNGVPVKISDGRGLDDDPAWSPAGGQIAFDSHGRPDSPDGIYITTPTGGSARYLAPGLRPDWSPDGTELAVTERSDDGTGGAHFEVVVISAADGHTIADLGPGDNASWSPDGSKIVFDSATTRAVSTVNPDGTGLAPVTSDGQSHQPDWQARACDTGTSASTSGASVSLNCRLRGG
ncbi:MAG: hypothetical protein QOJ29_3662 [Thermoleophilaceae bacterium]|nr:hypothetical protein [Thermoleophilaceae bacterium]